MKKIILLSGNSVVPDTVISSQVDGTHANLQLKKYASKDGLADRLEFENMFPSSSSKNLKSKSIVRVM